MDARAANGDPETAGFSFRRWWSEEALKGVDHKQIVDGVYQDSGWSSHFAVMTLLSAGIAVLGLLLASPAVVIGAMLISPLMGPIIGLGFGIATFDWQEIRRTLVPLVAGVALAVIFCAVIVWLSPLQTITSEITARTRPNLFDLLIALFSGLAGTYAVIRGRHGAIVGVAIATALMPPLAVMGFGVATGDREVLAGSSLLFFTNLMTISAAAAVLARVYGFASNLSPHQTRLQALLIMMSLAALAVPLGLSLKQIAWEALVSRETSSAIARAFPADARVNDVRINYDARPVDIEATVITPQYNGAAERELTTQLARLVGGPVVLSLDQVRAVHGDGALAASLATAGERSAARVAERLALVAGVPKENVLTDRVAHKAVVHAVRLPGAQLAVYRTLEERVAATERAWMVTLVPPMVALGDIPIRDGMPGSEELATCIWAAQRLQLPVGVSGGSSDVRRMIVKRLRDAGVVASEIKNVGKPNAIAVEWLQPDASRKGAD